MVITTAQFHSTEPKLRFCAGSNPACGVSEIRDGEDLWQWSRLEIRLNTFRRSTIPQKQFIVIIMKVYFVLYLQRMRILISTPYFNKKNSWIKCHLKNKISSTCPNDLFGINVCKTCETCWYIIVWAPSLTHRGAAIFEKSWKGESRR